MTIQTQQLARAFRYNSVDLADPGPQFSAEAVRDFYAPTYPEILNAAIEGPEEKDGKLVYTFRRAVGTKGADDRERGLYDKFRVERMNDPAGKHRDCSYFVLDLVHDRHAAPALMAYAASCAGEFPRLAADLQELAATIPNAAPADEWRSLAYAPLDGTEVELLVQHLYYFASLKEKGPQIANADWRQAVRGKWVDHNGGGWTWRGLAGLVIGWRPITL